MNIYLKLLEQSLSGHGAKGLTSESVEELFKVSEGTPYILQCTEAFLIEPQADRPMFGYSISGPLDRTGVSLKEARKAMIALFRELDKSAQSEQYAVRYTVWFSD